MKKKIIIGILIAALIAGGSAGGAVYYKKSHQKTVSVVSVDSLAGQYYMDDTNLEGNIVTSAVQNVSVDKDMIIKDVYVSSGDAVKKGDKLMSFDMTLVQMELNIAKLKQQQQEQQLNKAVNRLNSLKNGGKIEESDGEVPDDTGSDTDTESGMDNEVASSGTSMNGRYLAAAINPVLATALETVEAEAEEVGAEATTQNQETEEKTDGSTDENQNPSENSTENNTEDNSDVSVDFTDSGTEDSDSLIVEEEPSDDDQNNNFESGDDDNNQQDEDDTGDEENEQNKDLTD